MDEPDMPSRETVYRRTALRGALLTSPVWAAALWVSLMEISPRLAELPPEWLNSDKWLFIVLVAGSSLCLLPGLVLTGKPSGFGDAVKRGISSALAAAAGYLLLAFCAFFGADPYGPTRGAAFGLASAFGSLAAALLGTFIRLGVNYLFKTVFNPYKEAPDRAQK